MPIDARRIQIFPVEANVPSELRRLSLNFTAASRAAIKVLDEEESILPEENQWTRRARLMLQRAVDDPTNHFVLGDRASALAYQYRHSRTSKRGIVRLASPFCRARVVGDVLTKFARAKQHGLNATGSARPIATVLKRDGRPIYKMLLRGASFPAERIDVPLIKKRVDQFTRRLTRFLLRIKCFTRGGRYAIEVFYHTSDGQPQAQIHAHVVVEMRRGGDDRGTQRRVSTSLLKAVAPTADDDTLTPSQLLSIAWATTGEPRLRTASDAHRVQSGKLHHALKYLEGIKMLPIPRASSLPHGYGWIVKHMKLPINQRRDTHGTQLAVVAIAVSYLRKRYRSCMSFGKWHRSKSHTQRGSISLFINACRELAHRDHSLLTKLLSDAFAVSG